MIKSISISTKSRAELCDVTSKIEDAVAESKAKRGICHLFIPHTTAAVTINENADPSVRRDILHGLERALPFKGDYEHAEGNAAAHIKSSMIGTDKTILIENGKLKLGTWQGIFFCEFDGPRERTIFVGITKLEE